jgi:hypothetical protein
VVGPILCRDVVLDLCRDVVLDLTITVSVRHPCAVTAWKRRRLTTSAPGRRYPGGEIADHVFQGGDRRQGHPAIALCGRTLGAARVDQVAEVPGGGREGERVGLDDAPDILHAADVLNDDEVVVEIAVLERAAWRGRCSSQFGRAIMELGASLRVVHQGGSLAVLQGPQHECLDDRRCQHSRRLPLGVGERAIHDAQIVAKPIAARSGAVSATNDGFVAVARGSSGQSASTPE